MPDLLYLSAIFLAVLGGVVLTYFLFIFFTFHREAEGYLLRAAGRLWVFLLMLFLITSVVGVFSFMLLRGAHADSYLPRLLEAALVGVAVAIILESSLLPRRGAKVKTLQRSLTKMFLRLNLALRVQFAWVIEYCRGQDVYDCQSPDGWGLGIEPSVLRRRLRVLYEFHKRDIALARKDPTLLDTVGRTPWEFFIYWSGTSAEGG